MTRPGDLSADDRKTRSKAAWRALMREQLQKISSEERAWASAQACQLLQQQAIWQSARSILLYAPRRDELDIAPLADAALAAFKRLALPRYDPQMRVYRACQITTPLNDVPVGQFGIREPGTDAPDVRLNELDLILIPGVAFDEHGGRLGRGRGYYDRLLAGVQAMKCGLGYDLQVHPQIPVEPHDILLDGILTPNRWLVFRPRRHGHELAG